MKYNQIKINYVSKVSIDIVSDEIFEFFYLEDLKAYKIIDNIEKGIKMYPKGIKEKVERCNSTKLVDNIKKNFENDVKAIIINDFYISFDSIRNDIMPLVYEYDGAIIINMPIEEEIEEKISLIFNSNILDISDEEWEDTKQEAITTLRENYEEEIKNKEYIDEIYGDLLDFPDEIESDSEDDFLPFDEKKELFKLFNLENLNIVDNEEKDYNRFQYDDIIESYSYKSGDDELTLSLTSENDIIISDNDEKVKIKNSQFRYFINTLKNLINI